MIQVENLTKAYEKSHKAVDNITFEVNKGEIFGFIGPNGAGKTTTIKMITGILKPDAGNVHICGVDLYHSPIEAKTHFAYVPDSPDIYKSLKGIEYLKFMADIYRVESSERNLCIEKYGKMFELEDALNAPIMSYSHGMQQKIVLMGALIHDPEVLILDEPMVGLDPQSAYNLKQLMRQRCEEGKSVFFSTHVLEVAEKFCNRIAIIKKGNIIAQGTLDALRNGQKSESLEEIFLELTQDE